MRRKTSTRPSFDLPHHFIFSEGLFLTSYRRPEAGSRAFDLFSANPAHPSLQFKQVHATEPIFSARISLHYRALARRADNDWIWFWIGSHADYDQLLKRL